MPWHHQYIGNPFLTWIFNRAHGSNISDCAFRIPGIHERGIREDQNGSEDDQDGICERDA